MQPSVHENENPNNKDPLLQPTQYRNVKSLIAIVCALCLSPFYYGFTLTYLSTINPSTLAYYFGQEAGEPVTIGFLIGIVPIGAGFGALLATFFMKFLSRRFLQGFVFGNYMGITPLYINELSPISLRGSLGTFSQFFNIGAVVTCYGIGLILETSHVNEEFFWRFMFSFTLLTVGIQSVLLIFNFIPESPSSLIEQSKLREAKRVLAKFNSDEVLNVVFQEYIRLSKKNKFEIHYRLRENANDREIGKEMNSKTLNKPTIFKISDEDGSETDNPHILASPSFQKKLTHSSDYTIEISEETSRSSMQAVSNSAQKTNNKNRTSAKAYFLGFELPLMQPLSGVKTIVTQIRVIMYLYDHTLALYTPLVVNIIQFISTALSIFVFNKLGRRPILLMGNLGVAVCSYVIAFFFLALDLSGNSSLVFGSVTFILIFMIVYGLTIGPAVWLYVPEVIPSKIVPAATFMNWLGVSATVMITPVVIEYFHSAYPLFFFFGGISSVFLVANYFLVVETKGLQPSEISERLQ